MGGHAVLRIYGHEFVDAFTRSLQLEREKDARILDSQKSSTGGAKR